MIAHFIEPTKVIVSVSACGRFAIVGNCPKYDASCVWECYRLRWDASAGVFVKSNTRKHLSFKVGARLLAGAFENYDWFEPANEPTLAALNVEPQLSRARVRSSELKKFAMLAAKAGGDDALIAVRVGAGEVSLTSLGPAALSKVLETRLHNSGDGSCVVYAAALKQFATRANSEDDLAVSYVDVEHRGVLQLGAAQLWTVNLRVPEPEVSSVVVQHYPLAGAMRRAFGFASTDDARPNLAQIMIKRVSDSEVMVYGTNGHYVHRECVPVPSPLPRTLKFPLSLAKQLPRGESVSLAFADDHCRLTLKDGSSVRVDAGAVMPPCESLYNGALGLPTKVRGGEVPPGPHDCVDLIDAPLDTRTRFWHSLKKALDFADAHELARVWLVLTKHGCAYAIAGRQEYEPKNMDRASAFGAAYLARLFDGLDPKPLTLKFPHDPEAPLYLKADNIERLLCPIRT